MTERVMKAVIAERRVVEPSLSVRLECECPFPLGPPWRLSIGPESELIVTGLFIGLRDLFNDLREYQRLQPGGMMEIPQTGVAANAFAGALPGMPLHGPLLGQGAVVAIDLFNRWVFTQEVWVSLWGTLP